jgi:hypothetical protein
MLHIFTATRADQVPDTCHRVLSVDGAVPGALVTYDHHQTGERINLDALPPTIDLEMFDSVATTLADTDALASVVAVLAGGPAHLPSAARAVLEAASHRCDHLPAHPDHPAAIDRLGRGLDNYVGGALAACSSADRSATFARLCREVYGCVVSGTPLPTREEPHWGDSVAALVEAGGVTCEGGVLVVDLRRHRISSVRPDAWYALHPTCLAAIIADHHEDGGMRYTVGRNPLGGSTLDVRPILGALAAAEYTHGPPALGPEATPGNENWGGRREVGGSPWNYGSRLTLGTVVGIVRDGVG